MLCIVKPFFFFSYFLSFTLTTMKKRQNCHGIKNTRVEEIMMLSLSNDCHGIKNNKVDELPEHIMMLILSKLDLVGLHSFSAVCKSWQSIAIAAMKLREFHLQPQPPWVLLSFIGAYSHIAFYSFSHGKIFRLESPRQAYDAEFLGSNWGWLIMAGDKAYSFLLNPFTRKLIELPPQSTLPDYPCPLGLILDNRIQKAILSSPPVLDDCVIIAIYDDRYLAFCKPGEEMWTTFPTYRFDLEDIIFYDGKLYAITKQCGLRLVELDPHPRITNCNIAPPLEEDIRHPYMEVMSVHLVESLGELLMVIRYVIYVYSVCFPTSMFKIFKLDEKGRSWIKVKDLGDQMLFIGTSTGCSLSACDFPGFRRNCIYFTEENRLPVSLYGWKAILFHLENNRIEHIKTFGRNCCCSRPIWFTPYLSREGGGI
ncbi:hypothetical protein NE237_001428 [Protea cynaroides]|uniref:F-box domain-containing protein n=1 Tax=Protea cynaroides TaxID=273540 RepID=A0A9Q0KTB3_9MAGN|nr:hypothetical protein NE237_001428 [Protea cynaroides]